MSARGRGEGGNRVAKRQVVLVVLGVAAALSLGGAGGSAVGEPAAQTAPTVVTLVTGDRVTLDHSPDGRPIVAVEPVDRQAGTGFQTLNAGGHRDVVPGPAPRYLGAAPRP